jgi:hypothetical protein
MIHFLPTESYNLLSVFLGFMFFAWMFRLIEKFNKLTLLREAMRDNRVSHIPAVGGDLVEFEFCTEPHFRALAMVQQDSPPVPCPQLTLPFHMKEGSLELSTELSHNHEVEGSNKEECNRVLTRFEFESSVPCSIQLVYGLKKSVLLRQGKGSSEENQEDENIDAGGDDSDITSGDNGDDDVGIELKSIETHHVAKVANTAPSSVEFDWEECVTVSSPQLFDIGENTFDHRQVLTPSQVAKLGKKKNGIFMSIIFQRIDLQEGSHAASNSMSMTLSLFGHRRSYFDKSFTYSPASMDVSESTQQMLGDILGISYITSSDEDEKSESLVGLRLFDHVAPLPLFLLIILIIHFFFVLKHVSFIMHCQS